jgi:hypothetical protein
MPVCGYYHFNRGGYIYSKLIKILDGGGTTVSSAGVDDNPFSAAYVENDPLSDPGTEKRDLEFVWIRPVYQRHLAAKQLEENQRASLLLQCRYFPMPAIA